MASLVVTCPHCGLKTLTTHDECLHCEKTLGPLAADIAPSPAEKPKQVTNWPLETPLPSLTPEPVEPEVVQADEFIASLPEATPPPADEPKRSDGVRRHRLAPRQKDQNPADTVWPPKPRGFAAPKRIMRRVNPNKPKTEDLPDLRPSQRGKCPAGHGPLRQGHIAEHKIQHCKSCDSMWLTHKVFLEFMIMQAKQVLADGTIPPLTRSDLTQPPSDRPPMRCPDCTEPMQRTPHPDIPGIPLDVCADHGVWLRDRDLQAVMRFIATAGRENANMMIEKSK